MSVPRTMRIGQAYCLLSLWADDGPFWRFAGGAEARQCRLLLLWQALIGGICCRELDVCGWLRENAFCLGRV